MCRPTRRGTTDTSQTETSVKLSCSRQFRRRRQSLQSLPSLCRRCRYLRQPSSLGLPYMTSAQKGGGTPYIFCRQRGGEGVKKSQNCVDVIYGSPLSRSPIPSSFLNFARSVPNCQTERVSAKLALFRSSPMLLSEISSEKARMPPAREEVRLEKGFSILCSAMPRLDNMHGTHYTLKSVSRIFRGPNLRKKWKPLAPAFFPSSLLVQVACLLTLAATPAPAPSTPQIFARPALPRPQCVTVNYLGE